ncbi:hypothetical protein D9M71_743840 [compost metagenome]
MFIAPVGNAQTRGLDDVGGRLPDVFYQQHFMVEAFGVPYRHFQAQRLAEQGLPGTEFL